MQGKVVIVTGASSGIGEALVNELAKRKAKIVAAARSIDKLNAMICNTVANINKCKYI